MTLTTEQEQMAAHYLQIMQQARDAGKGWWVEVQMRQIDETISQAQTIRALTHALEMVRDADNDCKADGGHPLPIPPVARAAIDAALAFVPRKNRFIESMVGGGSK